MVNKKGGEEVVEIIFLIFSIIIGTIVVIFSVYIYRDTKKMYPFKDIIKDSDVYYFEEPTQEEEKETLRKELEEFKNKN